MSETIPVPRPLQPDGRVHGVVVACSRSDGRWLCIRRSKSVAAPLRVCFPGGAMEVGESQAAAAIREMREELAASVRPIANIWRWDSPESPLTLWGWTAELLPGVLVPDPAEVAEILWLTSEEVAWHHEGMPTNSIFIAALQERDL